MIKNGDAELIPSCLRYEGWEKLARQHIAEAVGNGLSQQPINVWIEWISYSRPEAFNALKQKLYEHHPDRGCRL